MNPKYKYNEDGQRTKLEPKNGEPATTYGYDQAGTLTTIEREKGAKQTELTETTAYDGSGLPQELAENGTKYKSAWDTAEPLPIVLEAETGAGGEEEAFIYGPENLPIEEAFGTNSVYLHHDQQGSTRLVTYWQHGEIVGWKNYGPYGNILETAGDATSLAYDGQPYDPETGLAWLGARKYDTSTGQFMSVDPAVEDTSEAYAYGEDNPEDREDISGQCSGSGESAGVLGCVKALYKLASNAKTAYEDWGKIQNVPGLGPIGNLAPLAAALAAVVSSAKEVYTECIKPLAVWFGAKFSEIQANASEIEQNVGRLGGPGREIAFKQIGSETVIIAEDTGEIIGSVILIPEG